MPHESLVEFAKRTRRSFARVSMRDEGARCKVMRIVAIVYLQHIFQDNKSILSQR